MKIVSKIKALFNDDILKLLAAVCDTKQIESAIEKMTIIHGILKDNGIVFEPQGEGTNRIAIFANSYVYKIALDTLGYTDNLMEYTLSDELQPYVTNTYETNGYILVAEYVKTIALQDYNLRKQDMRKILDIIGGEYLLHDVGIVKKNFTNWGTRDSGELVILDYAYLHRATETLFSCDICGSVLTYDETFSHLQCTNFNGCGNRFNYNDKKDLSKEVDKEMIDEAKDVSITFKDSPIIEIETLDDGRVIDSNTIVIKTNRDYYNYIKEVNNMITGERDISILVEAIKAAKEGKDPDDILINNDTCGEEPTCIFDIIGRDDDIITTTDKGIPIINEEKVDLQEVEDNSVDDLIAIIKANKASISDEESNIVDELTCEFEKEESSESPDQNKTHIQLVPADGKSEPGYDE